MFEASQLVFYYAVSPVHMGAGSAIGAIDSPIQREVHTRHPMFAGSGLKGALRHHVNRAWSRSALVRRIFGPQTNASDFAGALSLSDAQLVALPVRALKGGFAYATSPLALARLQRLAVQTGLDCPWAIPPVQENQAKVCGNGQLLHGKLVLEAFEFAAQPDAGLTSIAQWLAKHALPGDANTFFADKLATDLVLLHDTDFAHFARHAMVVEPHVCIDDDTGAAKGSGLFYVENLPPETLMVGLAQASVERYKKEKDGKKPDDLLAAHQVLSTVFAGNGQDMPGIGGKLLQIGGDATTGRGLVLVQPVKP